MYKPSGSVPRKFVAHSPGPQYPSSPGAASPSAGHLFVVTCSENNQQVSLAVHGLAAPEGTCGSHCLGSMEKAIHRTKESLEILHSILSEAHALKGFRI